MIGSQITTLASNAGNVGSNGFGGSMVDDKCSRLSMSFMLFAIYLLLLDTYPHLLSEPPTTPTTVAPFHLMFLIRLLKLKFGAHHDDNVNSLNPFCNYIELG